MDDPTRLDVKQFLKSRTGRLTLTYLAIIMSMTILFSIVIFFISSAQFDRTPRPDFEYLGYGESVQTGIEDVFRRRVIEAKIGLVWSLSMLNLVSLVGGALFSYYLARLTMRPIEDALESQSQFVSDASHELRTPLTALQTANEVALRRKQLTLTQAKAVLQQNIDETEKLRSLSDALLGLVKEEHADRRVENVFVNDVVGDVLQVVASQALAKKIAINDDTGSLSVRVNKVALTQILKILLENAVKYSPQKTSISVSAKKAGDYVVISVSDQGPGIAREEQSKIFDRFYRVDSSRSTQHEDGNGLGLAIAKTIADRQGIKLGVDSQLGQGASFTVTVRKSN